ncbi:heavy metal-binding protein HIP-like [Saccostrea cucullata]|uniref:heavy metal-binding protein HIP-like n=1 Tax=Saccostrea cuccullata TaxID=36930 RepID=UPI002ED2EF64
MHILQFLTLVFTSFLLCGVNAGAGTKDFLKKFKTYNEVCRGMGFKGDTSHCQGGEKAIISFHARMESYLQNLGNNAVVVFGNVTENSGSAYNGNTGKFTAPQNGIYSFTWTILTAPGRMFNTNIVLNDISNIIGYNQVNGKSGSQTYAAGSATTIIKMKKNDKVWIKTHEGEGIYAYGSKV